jgi:hypothetical protein
MSRFIPFLFLFFCSFIAFSQSICIQVVASGGGSGTYNGRNYDWTIGEAVVATLETTGYKFTQGFQQPDVCMAVSTESAEVNEWQLEVFPNPTADVLNIRFAAEKTGQLHATVYHLTGQLMLHQQVLEHPEGTQIDCQAWQAGVYVLQLIDPATRASTSLRFIRL